MQRALLALLVPLAGCASLPPQTAIETSRIEGLPGPEDLLVDRESGAPRLLVSSQDRRQDRSREGAIVAVDLSTRKLTPLPRRGAPAAPPFHPHGMDLRRGDDGRLRLYVITHHRTDAEPRHAIHVYEVFTEYLQLVDVLEDPLLVSPNDLAARRDGRLYVSNDRGPGEGWGSLMLGRKSSTVVTFDPAARAWSVAADDLAMANGIALRGDTVYVAATGDNAVYSYWAMSDGLLRGRLRVAAVGGPDNLSWAGDHLLVAAHERPLDVAWHMADPEHLSPSAVYEIDPQQGRATPLFADDGSRISAAATAVVHEGALYIGQIAGDHLLVVGP